MKRRTNLFSFEATWRMYFNLIIYVSSVNMATMQKWKDIDTSTSLSSWYLYGNKHEKVYWLRKDNFLWNLKNNIKKDSWLNAIYTGRPIEIALVVMTTVKYRQYTGVFCKEDES
jgi:hypothetical protein